MLEIKQLNIKKFSFLLTLVLVIFFGYEIGNRPFADPDEGRYVEIPREMVVTGDYITPRLNGLKYFEKPPLIYWLQAATIKTVGIGEYSMRFWMAFFAVFGCLNIFLVGFACKSIALGLLSAGILATNLLYYAHSRIIILDLAVSVLMSGVLWCFFLAFVRKREKPSKKLVVSMYAFAALACLTKGLIGIILPGFVGFLWICFTNNWKKIKDIVSIRGILVFLIIFLPWHVAVCIKNADFFHFYFVVEHFLRYTTQLHSRYQPIWFFLPIIIAGMLPWTGFSLVALKESAKNIIKKADSDEDIFLLCWIFGIFGFFSFSNSKLVPYILPIVPPIAFLTAKTLIKINVSDKNVKIGALLNIAIFVLAIVAFHFEKDRVADVLGAFPEVYTLMNAFALILFACVILLFYMIFSKLKQVSNSIILYVFLAMNLMWILNKAAPFYQAVKKPSTKQLAEIVRMNARDEDLIFCHKRYQQDFPVYLERLVGVTDHAGELDFGNKAEKNDRLITEDQLFQRWDSDKRIFLLMTREDYRKFFHERTLKHIILDFDRDFIVISNR